MNSSWLLYGANGYTGKITARLAVERGFRPILAGRNAFAIPTLAHELGLEFRIFDLKDSAAIASHLRGVAAVLHMAGPFSATSQPMLAACLQAHIHYLDITGEIEVFEAAFERDDEAKQAGIVIMPGVGFDVVPTDCLAAMLKDRLPDATHLELAFAGTGRSSKGTTKTAIAALPKGGRVRLSGKITQVPFGWKRRAIAFQHAVRNCVTIPWGDVSTAYYTTGIPNICVYTVLPMAVVKRIGLLNRFAPILGLKPAQSILKKVAVSRVRELSETERQQAFSEVWGEVWNAQGKAVTGRLTTPEGYTLTAESSLAAMQRILRGNILPGVWTPAKAFGANFVTTLAGVQVHPFETTGD